MIMIIIFISISISIFKFIFIRCSLGGGASRGFSSAIGLLSGTFFFFWFFLRFNPSLLFSLQCSGASSSYANGIDEIRYKIRYTYEYEYEYERKGYQYCSIKPTESNIHKQQ